MSTQRKIIHIDMDAFYASVEQRDFPELRGKPIAVGGAPEKRGAVAAASYEARKYGVHSALSSRLAKQRCPQLIFVKPRFEIYSSLSKQIRSIFQDYADLVEPVAFDEAYLDVTENKPGIASAQQIAEMIRSRIFQDTQLTASAGISVNKFLAKMASGLNKPNGQAVILPQQAESFVAQLAIEKFHGIGKATAKKMYALQIYNGADLRARSQAELIQRFGKVGGFYYGIARGEDDRPVVPNRLRKSLSIETSYDPDLVDVANITQALTTLAIGLDARRRKINLMGHTLILKVKFANYSQITRSFTQEGCFTELANIQAIGQRLLDGVDLQGQAVRLLGLGIGKLDVGAPEFRQLDLDL
jgi:DNA polymerase IV